jgi:hypothetical protein
MLCRVLDGLDNYKKESFLRRKLVSVFPRSMSSIHLFSPYRARFQSSPRPLSPLLSAQSRPRAGEHGKGFAVVASEVRTLASTRQAEQAAQNLTELSRRMTEKVRAFRIE